MCLLCPPQIAEAAKAIFFVEYRPEKMPRQLWLPVFHLEYREGKKTEGNASCMADVLTTRPAADIM